MHNFEWDKNKNLVNQEKHLISFEEAAEIFKYRIVTKIDNRQDYQEIRKISLGRLSDNQIVICCVHTSRNKRIRIISARKANKLERNIYNNFLKNIN